MMRVSLADAIRPPETGRHAPNDPAEAAQPAIVVTLPWSALMGDNHRLIPVKRGASMRLIANPEYAATKERAAWLMRAQNGPATALTGPVSVVGRVWFPDRRKRDAGNYRKMVTDAMSDAGVVADDSLVHDERWIRVGLDKDSPRMVVTITPMGEP
jgi:crossover junction endodeoxyribonuclease RusA